jgi:hypothetical protein
MSTLAADLAATTFLKQPPRAAAHSGWLHRFWSVNSEFLFHDRWRLKGRQDDVARALLDTATMSQWWPQISRISIDRGGRDDGARRAFAARTFGFMPYVLAVQFHVVEVEFPNRFSVEIEGDLQGHGGGTLRQEGAHVAVDFESRIRVARRDLRWLSLVARPAMYANHCWLMRQGEIGLQRALDGQMAGQMLAGALT